MKHRPFANLRRYVSRLAKSGTFWAGAIVGGFAMRAVLQRAGLLGGLGYGFERGGRDRFNLLPAGALIVTSRRYPLPIAVGQLVVALGGSGGAWKLLSMQDEGKVARVTIQLPDGQQRTLSLTVEERGLIRGVVVPD